GWCAKTGRWCGAGRAEASARGGTSTRNVIDGSRDSQDSAAVHADLPPRAVSRRPLMTMRRALMRTDDIGRDPRSRDSPPVADRLRTSFKGLGLARAASGPRFKRLVARLEG